MPDLPAHDPAGLEARLREQALRDRPAFDAELHARIMRGVGEEGLPPAVLSPPTPWRMARRYALAAGVILAAGLVAVAGSGWLQQRVRAREARREALASVTELSQAAWRVAPGPVLGDADRLLSQPWRQVEADVQRQGEAVRSWWTWPGLGSSAPRGSENMPAADPPGGM